MDRDVIDQKLESLRRCIKRAREKCPMELDAQLSIDRLGNCSRNLSAQSRRF